MTISTPRATAEITKNAGEIVVTVAWDAQVDRNRVSSWALGPRHGALAERLKRAVDALAGCLNPAIRRDNAGKTYVSAESCVMGRTMNADLMRLGY